MSKDHPFLLERQQSPLREAMALVGRSLKRDQTAPLTPAEMAWLFERPTLWLRALVRVREEVIQHGRQANGRLEALKKSVALPGGRLPEGDAGDVYREAKREHERSRKSRAAFLVIVEAHIEEMKAVCGPNALHSGDVIHVLTQAAELLDDGDTDAGLDLLLSLIEKWSEPYGGQPSIAYMHATRPDYLAAKKALKTGNEE